MSSLFQGYREVPGYEGIYYINENGDVLAMPRYGSRHKEPYIMARCYDNHGYTIACLSKNNTHKTVRIHRVVAQLFIPNPNGYREINHKDENPANPSASNLEWCDRKYNVNYGTRTQKTQKPVLMFRKDGSFVRRFSGIREASQYMNSSNISNISYCCKGKRHSAFGYLWRFENDII